jgi:serine/threonine protein kinase
MAVPGLLPDITAGFVEQQFPINLRSIGINMELNRDTFANLSNDFEMINRPPHLIERIQLPNLNVAANKFIPGSFITVDGIRYDVVAHIGEGSYGRVCKLVNRATNTYFALKEQESDPHQNIAFIKETVINHIIYETTKVRPFAPKVHKIFMGIRGGTHRFYSLTECLDITYSDVICTIVDAGKYKKRTAELLTAYRQLVPVLQYLFTTYFYNHGDLKQNNFMKDTANNYRLIDFGFSRLTLKDGDVPYIIETNKDFNNTNMESHDLSLMSTQLGIGHNYYDDVGKAFLTTIVSGYNCNSTREGDWECKSSKPTGLLIFGKLYLPTTYNIYELPDSHEIIIIRKELPTSILVCDQAGIVSSPNIHDRDNIFCEENKVLVKTLGGIYKLCNGVANPTGSFVAVQDAIRIAEAAAAAMIGGNRKTRITRRKNKNMKGIKKRNS